MITIDGEGRGVAAVIKFARIKHAAFPTYPCLQCFDVVLNSRFKEFPFVVHHLLKFSFIHLSL